MYTSSFCGRALKRARLQNINAGSVHSRQTPSKITPKSPCCKRGQNKLEMPPQGREKAISIDGLSSARATALRCDNVIQSMRPAIIREVSLNGVFLSLISCSYIYLYITKFTMDHTIKKGGILWLRDGSRCHAKMVCRPGLPFGMTTSQLIPHPTVW